MRVIEGDAERLPEIASLHERVWGTALDPRELGWLYNGNPVAAASVLLAEEDGRVVGSVAMSFLRFSVGGWDVKAGMPIHLATDPGYRGRGVFTELQAANEERAREAGAKLLFVVPTPASAAVLRARLGWMPLPPIRVWARLRALRTAPRARVVTRFEGVPRPPADQGGVARDASWLNWRFADAPRGYRLLDRGAGGYAVVGRRGRLGVVAALAGDLLADAAAAGGAASVASPPRAERRRYALGGYVPTPRTFTLLGKSLDLATPLPSRPHFELGDLDFF